MSDEGDQSAMILFELIYYSASAYTPTEGYTVNIIKRFYS